MTAVWELAVKWKANFCRFVVKCPDSHQSPFNYRRTYSQEACWAIIAEKNLCGSAERYRDVVVPKKEIIQEYFGGERANGLLSGPLGRTCTCFLRNAFSIAYVQYW